MAFLLLVAMVYFSLASTDLSVLDSCESENATLKKSIQKLENNIFIVAWQVRHMQRHKYYFQPLHQNVVDKNLQSQTDSNGTNSSGTVDHPIVTQMTPLPSAGSLIVHDKDCSELFDRLKPPSGFHRIRPISNQDPFLVYCDMEDGGGWTVFQRRRHGKVDFNRDWVDYKDGFGDFKLWNDEFWLGNEHIYSLLSEGKNLVKINLMDWEGHKSYAFYENFRISSESDKYRLQYSLYSGKAGDALTGGGGMVEQWSACLSGMQFSTKNQDNDRYYQGSCAQENQAGWWFNRQGTSPTLCACMNVLMGEAKCSVDVTSLPVRPRAAVTIEIAYHQCHAANLNGKFYRKGNYKGQFDNGVVWGTWRGLWYSLRHTTMKVRPLFFLDAMGSGNGAL